MKFPFGIEGNHKVHMILRGLVEYQLVMLVVGKMIKQDGQLF
jgi:hypothetical protein